MPEYRSAKVLVQGIPAGIIRETEDGYSFSYDAEYVQNNQPAVSLSLPVTTSEYHSATLFPFFDGLIPEGWLLDVVIRNWKLSANDRFGLLLSACKDCIGDVSIVSEEEI